MSLVLCFGDTFVKPRSLLEVSAAPIRRGTVTWGKWCAPYSYWGVGAYAKEPFAVTNERYHALPIYSVVHV